MDIAVKELKGRQSRQRIVSLISKAEICDTTMDIEFEEVVRELMRERLMPMMAV